MAIKIKPPVAPSELDSMLEAEGVEQGNTGEFIKSALANIDLLLKKSPKRYYSYGPYWYRIKALLNAYGYNYGDDMESELPSIYVKDEHTIAAAILHSNAQVMNGLNSTNTFQLELEDGEFMDYILEDRDLEAMIFAESLNEQS